MSFYSENSLFLNPILSLCYPFDKNVLITYIAKYILGVEDTAVSKIREVPTLMKHILQTVTVLWMKSNRMMRYTGQSGC